MADHAADHAQAVNAPWTYHVMGACRALDIAIGCRGSWLRPRQRFSRKAVEALRPLLPYCLHPVDASGDTLIWLNRDYKPLGTAPRGYQARDQIIELVPYGCFESLHIRADDPVLTVTYDNLRRLNVFRDAVPVWFFFDDTSSPWSSREHAERLFFLLRQVVASAKPEVAHD